MNRACIASPAWSSRSARRPAFARDRLISPGAQTRSKREQETLPLLTEGFRYKEIADKLGISFHIVREHVHIIYAKRHVTSRTEAAMK